jgi:hypothetical protein
MDKKFKEKYNPDLIDKFSLIEKDRKNINVKTLDQVKFDDDIDNSKLDLAKILEEKIKQRQEEEQRFKQNEKIPLDIPKLEKNNISLNYNELKTNYNINNRDVIDNNKKKYHDIMTNLQNLGILN